MVKLMRVVSLQVKKIMVSLLHLHLLNQFIIELGQVLSEVQYFEVVLLEQKNFTQIAEQNLWQ